MGRARKGSWRKFLSNPSSPACPLKFNIEMGDYRKNAPRIRGSPPLEGGGGEWSRHGAYSREITYASFDRAMHIRSMHNKRVYIHPLFTLPGQRLYISQGECARLCLHRRDPLHENLGAGARACVSFSFFFLEISLDRDDFFAAY